MTRLHPLPSIGHRLIVALGLISILVLSTFADDGTAAAADPPPQRPNMIFILADDLGYGDLGCYGQTVIQTPRLDRMAAEGMRFTQFYAGSTVCAPSRSVLMTGQHMGHTHVRGNAGAAAMERQSLREEDVTVAEVLKKANYTNALIGKWGLGEIDMPGHPLKQGFDSFYGYLNQAHAHNYYPEFLYRGFEKELLRNEVQRVEKPAGYQGFIGGAATKRIDYSHDLFASEALEFLRTHQDETFFLYLALTIPHANNEGSRLTGDGAEVPDYGPYADKDWPNTDKGQAAMITRMDSDIGRILDLLAELGIEENTLVFFTSDNGPHNEARHDLERFDPSGPLRGIKRALYEGGIRVPAICRMPGTVPAGTVTDHVAYFGDWMATAAELAGVEPPAGIDSISFVPTLLGNPDEQQQHEYLYWEFYEQGSRQAVRFGAWKAIRQPMLSGPVELYNLESDLGETNNVAADHPEVVAQAVRYMEEAHAPHPNWQVPEPKRKKPSTR
ncbi:arylsulfatase [Candidatus Laterigemmans baculatus]|uniref:arylsulfatase n=1 Tax=Candidatus Laterigemmans baculatus TaxID=2770505 RepID=UPI0013D94D6D|nr:arylsulfatase [Candidatus Laterigemmans baculatus]